jgi:phytoene synthase
MPQGSRVSRPPRPTSDPATIYGWAATRLPAAAAALFALDRTLGDIARTTQQPIVGQMRLTWWHDALLALDERPAPAHPVLRDLAAAVLPTTTGATLAGMVAAWDVVIDPDMPDAAALAHYAEARGGTLFRALAEAAGVAADDRVAAAGAVWALADLAAGVRDAALAAQAVAAVRPATARAFAARWPAAARAIGALAVDAALAIDGRGAAGSPRRAAGVLRFRVTGR